MKFIKIKDTKLNIQYDWMADIQSFDDLIKIEELFVSRNAWGISDYMKSKDYVDDINQIFKGNNLPQRDKIHQNHCHPQNKIASFLRTSLFTIPQKTKIYPLLYFSQKLNEVVQNKAKHLLKHKRILINENGGYMTWHDNLIETDCIKSENFPQYMLKDIKVSKWERGTHWYITYNGVSIILEGIEKWNTEKLAWDAIKRCMEKSS